MSPTAAFAAIFALGLGIVVLLCLAGTLVGVAVNGTLYWLGAKIVKVKGATFGKALATAFYVGIATFMIQVGAAVLTEFANVRPPLMELTIGLAVVGGMVVTLSFLCSGFETNVGTALRIWVWSTIIGILTAIALLAVFIGILLLLFGISGHA